MPAQPGDVTVIAPIAPKNSGPFPVARSDDLLGTPKISANLVARDAIPDHVRQEGMLAYVLSNATWYQLIGGIANGNWQEADIGGAEFQIDDFVPVDGQTVFNLSQTPADPNSVAVEINGATYRTSQGYFTVVGTVLTWLDVFVLQGAPSADVMSVIYTI